MTRRTIQLQLRSLPGEPALDTALSRALLARVAEGRAPETLRLHRPDDVVAFSPVDTTRPGFPSAVRAAREVGFDAVVRLAGGHAAVFHRETLAFAWCIPAPDPRRGIRSRFEAIADATMRALRRLGVDARVGEVAGEYCAGQYSVNARGRKKIMGVGQRIVRGAAHVGGVVVVRGSQRAREVLVPVYDALGLSWDPGTVGSVEDELGPVTRGQVIEALLAELRADHDLVPGSLDDELLCRARDLAAAHRIVAPPASRLPRSSSAHPDPG